MLCPKCGREVEDSAAICPGCDFILDTSFLGEDITDAESDKRVRRKKAKAEPETDYGEDALILGDLGDEIDSFQSADTGFVQRELTNARIYIGGAAQQMLAPDVIPAIVPGITLDTVRLTPFERHVLEYVNGKRPVARIKKKAGLDENELRTTLATLTDKGFLRVAGKARRKKAKAGERTRIEDISMSVAEATVISEIPSSMLVDSSPGDGGDLGDDGDGGVFAESTAQSRLLSDEPEPPPGGDIHREVTLIQRAPEPSEGDDGFASAEERALSYADSLLSEEPVVGAPRVDPDEETRRKDAATARRPKKRKRPPLPGEVDPGALRPDDPAAPAGAEPPPTGPVDVPAALEAAIPPPLPSEALRSAEDLSVEELSAEGDGDGFPVDLLSEEGARFEEGALTGAEHPRRAEEEFPSAIPTQPPSDPVPVAPEEISLKVVVAPGPAAPEPPPPPVAIPPAVPPLPGQGVPPPPLPGQAPVVARAPVAKPAAPPPPVAPVAPPMAPEPAPVAPALDDEDIEHDSDEGEPVDEGAQVPFEMRRKAEKIFEQAEQDIAEGRVSSALMNAKLAAIYNPHEPRYPQAIREWEQVKPSRPQKRSPQQHLVEQAQQAEAKGNYQRAVELLQQAIELDPRAAALHNRLGVLLATRLQRYREATAAVMRAIELNPQNPAYKNNLGKILAKEDDELEKQGMKQKKKKDDDGAVIVKKLRPKLF